MLNRFRTSLFAGLFALGAAVCGSAAFGAAAQSPVGIFGGVPTFAQLPGNYSLTITASAGGAATATLSNAWPYATTSTAIAIWPDGESRTVTLTSAATTLTWTTNIVSTGTTLVIDGQTQVPGAGTVGWTSDFGAVVSNGTVWSYGTSNTTDVGPTAVVATVLSGCTTITLVNSDITSLRFTTTATTCTPILLLPYSPGGWICIGQDITSGHAVVFTQTAIATNSCTVTGTTTSGDTVVIKAFGL